MVRIICPECKNSYIDNKDGSLVCPSCNAVFSADEENLILGAQYYNECDYDKANDCLMKYIVKNGADTKAIFYKALCDGFCYDEDTLSLADTYEKLFDALKEMPEEFFPEFLAIANDEAEKLEKAVAQSHIHLFVDADAEKIKKEVSTIINLQNEAKAFRIRLNALVNDYNDTAKAKISVKFSECFLVEPELAAQVGDLKFEKIIENVASHTVFTGILSTDIKNLEIYYRCIVMFFKKNRQKYDFLMASAEKFTTLSKLLEEGQYNTIKGTSAIGDKLKSAGYDFFQESLKDNDEDFETQTETVVILAPVVEEEAEEEILEDVSSTSDEEIAEEVEAPAEFEDISSTENEIEEAVAEPDAEVAEEIEAEDIESTEEETSEEDSVIEIPVAEEASVEVEATEDVCEDNENADEVSETEEEAAEDTTAEVVVEEVIIEETTPSIEVVETIPDDQVKAPEEEMAKVVKRKKNYGPFIALFLIVAGIIAIICITVLPKKINENNYKEAEQLMADKKYDLAAEVYAELGDFEDAEEKFKAAKYSHAALLEEAENYEAAKEIYAELKTYEDSMAKVSSCTYNIALKALDDGKFDDAKALFESVKDYADSKDKVLECDYQKGISFIAEKKYADAIKIFEVLGTYSESKTKILEAKYKYVSENLSTDNQTTLAYLDDLIEARYEDSVVLRRKLLGTAAPENGIVACLNYSETEAVENLREADKSKPIYYHITVEDAQLYGKKLTVKFTTSVGYTERKTVTFTESNNTYTLMYPRTNITGYTVDFSVLAADGTELTKQTVTIK